MTAARRRLNEELGLRSRLSFGFFARYRAELDDGMTENELVYVYFGPLVAPIAPDPAEVANIEFLRPAEIKRQIKTDSDAFASWLRHYFRIHFTDIVRCAETAARRATG